MSGDELYSIAYPPRQHGLSTSEEKRRAAGRWRLELRLISLPAEKPPDASLAREALKLLQSMTGEDLAVVIEVIEHRREGGLKTGVAAVKEAARLLDDWNSEWPSAATSQAKTRGDAAKRRFTKQERRKDKTFDAANAWLESLLPLSPRLSASENRRRDRANAFRRIIQAAAPQRGTACPHGAEGQRFARLLSQDDLELVREIVAVRHGGLNLRLNHFVMSNDLLIKDEMWGLDSPVPVDENLDPLPGYPAPVYRDGKYFFDERAYLQWKQSAICRNALKRR